MAIPEGLEPSASRLTAGRSTNWAMEPNNYLRIKPPDRKPHRIYSRNVTHLRSGQVCKHGRYILFDPPCGAPPSSKLGWYSPCSFHHAYRATIQNYAYSMNLSSGLIHGVCKPTYAHISSPLILIRGGFRKIYWVFSASVLRKRQSKRSAIVDHAMRLVMLHGIEPWIFGMKTRCVSHFHNSTMSKTEKNADG